MSNFSRRSFIRRSFVSVGGSVVVSSAGGMLSACSGSSSGSEAENLIPASFLHGIASGDPLSDSVIIWTRVSPEDVAAERVNVSWEVATDENFNNLVVIASGSAERSNDFTLKVDVQGLEEGTQYYYRFDTSSETSPVGKTKTLPTGSIQQAKFIVVSCSNYPAGYFHAYAEAAKTEGVDAAIHLGDYLYEYERGGYASADAESLGRQVLPEEELFTLDDYRTRYAQYRSDADLQSFHQAFPMIAVWDDHEVANDAWREGAENHQDDKGDYFERMAFALQAYAEWMPIRPAVDTDITSLYRSFQFGDLINLVMLDTRLVGRDLQLNLASYFTSDGGFDTAVFQNDVNNENRSLLGRDQLAWLLEQLNSNATWQVLGQQVLMGEMTLPGAIATAQLTIEDFGILAQIAQLSQSNPELLTTEQSELLEQQGALLALPNLPYNLDAWDGYANERKQIFEAAIANNSNLVVLAGDTHNAWASNLTLNDENDSSVNVGVELATASVTSPGLETFLGLSTTEIATQTENGLVQLIAGLNYSNLKDRGYLEVTFTPNNVTSHWVYVSSIKERNYSVLSGRENIAIVSVAENNFS